MVYQLTKPVYSILGSECISLWVSPAAQGGSGNNTCPICRRELFPKRQNRRDSPLWPEHTRIHNVLWDRCGAICGMIDLGSRVMRLARGIANQLHDYIGLETRNFRDDAPFRAIAAASVFMACHLCGQERSLMLVTSCVHGVAVHEVTSTYALLFTHRLEVLEAEMLAGTGVDLDRIDERLPLPSSLPGVRNER